MTTDANQVRSDQEVDLIVTLDEVAGATIEVDSTTAAPEVLRQVAFVDLRAEYEALRSEIDAAMRGVLERGDFILGQAVADFEQAFAAYSEADYAVGVDSGYSALDLMLRAFHIGPGDEVITAANTFMATVGAIEAAGARPVLVDCHPETYNMDVELLEAAITPATRAILPVHLYGQPADMDAIREVAARHGLLVFEDSAQAHGARYKGRRAGSLGSAAAFSFYPAKNLGAFGDGGMVTTSDPVAVERLRLMRNLGSREKYNHEIRGFNHRLDTIQAAVLGVKLTALDNANAARRRAAALYREVLPQDVVTPVEADWAEHVYHLYVVRVPERARVMDFLKERGIATGIHYPVAVHEQPAFADLGYSVGDFPVTERVGDQIVSLPMHPGITAVDVVQVADALKAFFGASGSWS